MGVNVSLFKADRMLKKHSTLCKSVWEKMNDGTGDFNEQMKEIYESLLSFDFLPLKERYIYRKKAGDKMVETNCVRIICEHAGAMLPNKDANKNPTVALAMLLRKDKKEGRKKSCLELALESIALVTEPNCSAEAAKEVLRCPSLLPAILSRLEKIDEEGNWDMNEEVIFREGLSIIHNIAAYVSEDRDGYNGNCSIPTGESEPSAIEDVKERFMQRLKSENKEVKLLAITALCCLDETVLEEDQIQFMCLNLSMAFESGDHKSLRCSVTAMARGIRHLLTVRMIEKLKDKKPEKKKEEQDQTEDKTEPEKPQKEVERVIDATKHLVRCGVLRLLMKGVKSEIRQERMACLESLRILSNSVGECETIMARDNSFLDLLYSLHTGVADRELQELTSVILMGLWKHYKLDSGKKFKHLRFGQGGKSVKISKAGSSKGPVGHVMLSYQWESKDMVLQINKYLKKEGFITWIDEEKMSDYADINEAMANAVENASVFLMGVTEKYRRSPNCKKEANYAEICKKAIIPLKLQKSYEPDSWLGIIRGKKFSFDFTGKNANPNTLTSLAHTIRGFQSKEGKSDVDTQTDVVGTQTKAIEEGSSTRPEHSSEKGIMWVTPFCTFHSKSHGDTSTGGLESCTCHYMDDDVRKWAQNNGYDRLEAVRSFTRKDLDVYVDLKDKAPDFFYTRIWSDLKLKKPADVNRFLKALETWK